MSVKRHKSGRLYYYCRTHYSNWLEDPCPYKTFIPLTWDNQIWREICELFNDDQWIEKQLTVELHNSHNVENLIRLQEHKITSYQGKIRRVEEGFEGGLYTLEEAKTRKKKSLEAIETAQMEIEKLKQQIGTSITSNNLESLKCELRSLLDRNLAQASFEERLDLVAQLGIKVYPSEDLKSRHIKCGLNIGNAGNTGGKQGYAKVVYGRPYSSRTGDTLIESQVSRINLIRN
jgi:hypothetical protein